MLQDTNSSVHTFIQWLLWGSYVCFTTTSLDTFDTSTTCPVSKLLLLPVDGKRVSRHKYISTVLYKTLNMCLMASIIGSLFWELIGCPSEGGSNVANSLDSAYLGLFRCERESSHMGTRACDWSLASLLPESAKSFFWHQVVFECPHHLWLPTLLKLHSYKSKSIICRSNTSS